MRKFFTHIFLVFSMTWVVGLAFSIDAAADDCEMPDQDGDCVTDAEDNCRVVANEDQLDSNFNHIGNACEGDYDQDGVSDEEDNCWDVPNPGREDLDGDGVGDACDIDRDGDGLTNTFESTTLGTSPDDWDSDNDNVSDFYDCNKSSPEAGIPTDCNVTQVVQQVPPVPLPQPAESDPNGDDDGDGIANGEDNCPNAYNPGQQDQDLDGLGDACDNEFHINPELLFAKGGGGPFGGGSCAVLPHAASGGGSVLPLLILLPGLIFRSLRRSLRRPYSA